MFSIGRETSCSKYNSVASLTKAKPPFVRSFLFNIYNFYLAIYLIKEHVTYLHNNNTPPTYTKGLQKKIIPIQEFLTEKLQTDN